MGDGQATILTSIAEKTGWRQISGPLFRKYVGLFLAVVCVALLSNGLFEIIFSYREHTDALVRIQREQAEGAAEKIGHFIKEIENQMGWTTQLTWSASDMERSSTGLAGHVPVEGASPILSQRASRVRAAAFRRSALSLAKAISMGFKS